MSQPTFPGQIFLQLLFGRRSVEDLEYAFPGYWAGGQQCAAPLNVLLNTITIIVGAALVAARAVAKMTQRFVGVGTGLFVPINSNRSRNLRGWVPMPKTVILQLTGSGGGTTRHKIVVSPLRFVPTGYSAGIVRYLLG